MYFHLKSKSTCFCRTVFSSKQQVLYTNTFIRKCLSLLFFRILYIPLEKNNFLHRIVHMIMAPSKLLILISILNISKHKFIGFKQINSNQILICISLHSYSEATTLNTNTALYQTSNITFKKQPFTDFH